jgi:hypothetical protein
MVFKLVEVTEKACRHLDDNNPLPKLSLGQKFADGLGSPKSPGNREPPTVATQIVTKNR